MFKASYREVAGITSLLASIPIPAVQEPPCRFPGLKTQHRSQDKHSAEYNVIQSHPSNHEIHPSWVDTLKHGICFIIRQKTSQEAHRKRSSLIPQQVPPPPIIGEAVPGPTRDLKIDELTISGVA